MSQVEHVLWPRNVVRWRSRRGILELDLILMPFFNAYYHHLTPDQRHLHQWLLSQADADLQKWIFRKDRDPDLDPLHLSWIDFVSESVPSPII